MVSPPARSSAVPTHQSWYALIAPESIVAHHIRDGLSRRGSAEDAAASTVIVLDIPRGFAHQILATEHRPCVVVTDGATPEYVLDLSDHPQVIGAVPIQNLDAIQHLLEHMDGAGTVVPLPPPHSPLNSLERRMLRGVACGWTNKQIGEALGLHEKTVRNNLTAIYAALKLSSRTDALLYYWGLPATSVLGMRAVQN